MLTKQQLHFIFFFFVIWALPVSLVHAQNQPKTPPFYEMQDTRWADSVFKSLTPDERISQLFMVAAYSNKDKKHVNEIKKLIRNYKIGGLIFFQGGPLREAILTNVFQKLAKTPLLISMDAEWGLS